MLLPPDDARQALAQQLTLHLQTVRDLDRCAHVTLRAHDADLELEVLSGDGRSAARVVRTEAELLRASDALLGLPPSAKSPPVPSSPQEMPPTDPAPPTLQQGPRLELGLGASARLGGAPLFLAGGLSGFAAVLQSRWLLEVSARGEITGGRLNQPTLADYYLAGAALGAAVGRRFELRNSSIDALVGPRFVVETQDADDGNRDVHASAADVRLGLTARWSGARHSAWRAFASVDIEASPARLGKQRGDAPALPPFPSWTGGLSVGVTWATAVDGLAAGAPPGSGP